MSVVKSRLALEWNIELLSMTMKEGDRLCFWTFTVPFLLHPKEVAVMWSDMARELVRSLGFFGVRVFELHPFGHGLHVHVCTTRYFDVNAVRSIAERFGWGRLHVECWDMSTLESACKYMSKYVGKQGGKQFWQGAKLKGLRWWAVFGKVSDKVRISDVSTKSFYSSVYNRLSDVVVSSILHRPKPVNRISDVKEVHRWYMDKMKIVGGLVMGDPFYCSCVDAFLNVNYFRWQCWLDAFGTLEGFNHVDWRYSYGEDSA